MAEKQRRKTYPRIPAKNWWDLRRKFVQSPPQQVTADYLQSVLNVEVGAAKNLLSPLKVIGLIDENGKTTDLANDWRSDDHYPDACKTLVDEIYPSELRDALPGPKPNRDKVVKWFMRNVGTGEAAAKQMAGFYLLLCEADPAIQDQKLESGRSAAPKSKATKPKQDRAIQSNQVSKRAAAPHSQPDVTSGPDVAHLPSVHIDIQIHIAADASAEQIDQVFASMANHLYGK